MSEIPLVSVVVIGRNEGSRLEQCLRSVAAIRNPGGAVEVLYVDSQSTDGSPLRARALGAKVLRVEPARPCAAVGRNAGWKAARAPYVLFLDGDTVLHPDFVRRALCAFHDPTVAVVWGHRRERHPETSLYQRALDLDWIYPPGPSEFCGGDALFRRDVLERTGGFDEGLIAGEEPELCRRIRATGATILHVDLPMTLHDLGIDRGAQWWRRAFRAGHAYEEVSDRFRGTEIPLWERESRHHWRHGSLIAALLASVPIALACRAPAVALAAFAGFAALVLRSAWRARWKSRSIATLALYGLHSQLQHLPIVCGQLAYRIDRRRGRRRRLIEYKGLRQ